jgi:hypothetical protein
MPDGDKTHAQGPSAKDKQVREFISSTFRNMHADRDHPVAIVFPDLHERDQGERRTVSDKEANGGNFFVLVEPHKGY